MSVVWSWICENYKFLIALTLCVIELIVVLVRCNYKVVDATKEYILQKLPFLIASAESSLLDGADKKKLVIDGIVSLLKEEFPRITLNSKLTNFISDAIEDILSTPKKKEVN